MPTGISKRADLSQPFFRAGDGFRWCKVGWKMYYVDEIRGNIGKRMDAEGVEKAVEKLKKFCDIWGK